MTDKELQSLSDIFDGIFIGAGIFIVLVIIGFFAWIVVRSFIQWIIEYIEDNVWLSKRNRHRKKCGLPPIKNKWNKN